MPLPISKTPFSQGLGDYYQAMSKAGVSVVDAFARHMPKPKVKDPVPTRYVEVDVHGGVSPVQNPLGRGFFLAGTRDGEIPPTRSGLDFDCLDPSWLHLAKSLTGVDNPGLVRTARDYFSHECVIGGELLDHRHPVLRILRAQRLLSLFPTKDERDLHTALSYAGFTDSIYEAGPDVFAAFVGIVTNEYTDQRIVLARDKAEWAGLYAIPPEPLTRRDLPAREAIQQTQDELLLLSPAEITRARARELLLSCFSRLKLLPPKEQENFINNVLGISVRDGVVTIDAKILKHLFSDLMALPIEHELALIAITPEIVTTRPTALAVSTRVENGGILASAKRRVRELTENLVALLWFRKPAEPQLITVSSPQQIELPIVERQVVAPRTVIKRSAPESQVPQEEQNIYRRVVNFYREKHGPLSSETCQTLEAYLNQQRPLKDLMDANKAIFKGELEAAGVSGNYAMLVKTVVEYLQDDPAIKQFLNPTDPMVDEATRLAGWDERPKPKKS